MASAYLQRSIEAGSNGRTWTYSVWLKLSGVRAGSGANNQVWNCSSDNDSAHYVEIAIKNTDKLDIQFRKGTTGDNGTYIRRITTRLFRDPNAWYHIVFRMDTTQASASDRFRLYINGVQETSFSDSTGTIPQNYQTEISTTNSENRIGRGAGSSSSYWDGEMAHLHFCDGYSYAPTEFGETDSTTGIWKPKVSPSVSYGTNGCFLKFDNSANMGLDSSGQSHNFTVSGTIIQTKDTPSNNFATINPLNVPTSNAPTFANVNTTSTTPAASGRFGGTSTLGMSAGKYYWEAKYVISGLPRGEFGVTYDPGEQARNNSTASNYADAWCYQSEGGSIRNNNSNLDTEATYANGDIVMCALDLTNNKIYFGKNGTWVNSGDPTSGASGTGGYSVTADKTYFTITSDNTSGGDQQTYQFNFGNGYFGTTAVSSAQNPSDGVGVFEYSVPSGYKALCTKSLNAQEYS